MFQRLLLPCILLISSVLSGQNPVPAPAQKAPVLIVGAVAHLGNGKIIPNSAIAFDNGKLTMVADAATSRYDRTKYAKIYDATGKHVYPGFIAMNTSVGLVEIEAARATQDFAETGSYNPNVRALVAYNTDSDIPPTLRSNGVLLAQTTPSGGVLSGQSAVVQMDAWNWEDAAVREDGLHLYWPTLRSYGGWETGNPELKKNEQYDKDVQALTRFFSEARAYLQTAAPERGNLKFEAMRSLFEGKQNLYIHTDDAKTIEESVLFAEQFNITPVLTGASDAWIVTDFLKNHHISVILAEPQRVPAREDEDVDQPFKTAAALEKAGIRFAISGVHNSGEMGSSWKQRNLPFQAGQAVGGGLPYESAVRAITLDAAAILGIDATVGSLEVGKDATLFISEGDALDMRTCQVTAAFIQGREINLDNKQKQLARKFEAKYKQ
ncbi:MAG: amidohydrolase family protein [Bacteroidota bacterium]